MICAQCSKKMTRHAYIRHDEKHQHYRCCDADVCSWTCAVTRRKEICDFDPELASPVSWSKIKRTSSEHSLQESKPTCNMKKYNSMDILPDILEEDAETTYKRTETFSIAFFLAAMLSLLCVMTW